MNPFFRHSCSLILLCLLVALTIAVTCSNRADIFIAGRVYFIDADCYSRMTRVRMVLEHPTTIIRHHEFENYPQGTTPHTTLPFDYLIAALKKILDAGFWICGGESSPWASQTLDLAGAFVSPMLGVITMIFLWLWSLRLQLACRGMMLFLYAVSPIIVHGTILGRPDHQSLVMLLMAVALGAEWGIAKTDSRKWAILGGVAWGLGLWVTLYEPLVLLAAVVALNMTFGFRRFFSRGRALEYGLAFGILALSLVIEGWRVDLSDPLIARFFQNWEKTIGELTTLSLFSPVFFGWVGLLFAAAPVLLILGIRSDRRMIPLLLFVASLWALTVWQMRWGYFFALVFAMSIPFQMNVIRWRSVAWTLFILSLWPVAAEWDGRLFPEGEARVRMMEEREDKVLLRDAAECLKSDKMLPVLAPWWFSPALAYWSGQPAIGGSSHESLSGIVDSARFYLETEPGAACKILRGRKVLRVVVYDTGRVLETSSTLLGEQAPAMPMARILYERPHSLPDFFRLEYANNSFKVFSIALKEQ